MSSALERNKETVMAFYDLMFNQCKPAVQRYYHVNPADDPRKK